MSEMLLTFTCAAMDRGALTDRLRDVTPVPLHVRAEEVLGRDFGDAGAAEQVKGALRRVVIDLIVAEDAVDGLVQAVEGARRGHPVRWHCVAVARRGRIA